MSLSHVFAICGNNLANPTGFGVNLGFPNSASAITTQENFTASAHLIFEAGDTGVVTVRETSSISGTIDQDYFWVTNSGSVTASDFQVSVSTDGAGALASGSDPTNTTLSLGVKREWFVEVGDNGFNINEVDLIVTVTETANPSNTQTKTIKLIASSETTQL